MYGDGGGDDDEDEKKETYLNMRHAVVIKIRTGCKSFSAHLTLMWLFPAVYSFVRIQGTRCTESFTTDNAYMRFFTCRRNKEVQFKVFKGSET